MKVSVHKSDLKAIKSELLVIPFFEEEAARIKKKGGKAPYSEIGDLIRIGDFTGEDGKAAIVRNVDGKKRMLLLGMGKEKEVDVEKYRKAGAHSVNAAKSLKVPGFSVFIESSGRIHVQDRTKAFAEGAILGKYDFDKYKLEEKKKLKDISSLEIYTDAKDVELSKRHVDEASVVCRNVNWIRELTNESGDVMNPESMADLARDVAGKSGLKITVFDERGLRKMGMNLILAVGGGSKYSPRMVVMEHRGGKGKEKIALVGKGITFDTGGLDLKPFPYMDKMQGDKAGALAVLGTMKTLAELKVKKNVVGIMPLCENMIGPNSVKPGNVIKSFSGKTVEIVSTDAEGRLILADAVAYAEKKEKAGTIIDIATLTGACLGTFGEYVAGMFTNDEKLGKRMFEAGEKTYERVWGMPMYKEYVEEIKGETADLTNLGYMKGRYAGMIMAAVFLKSFTGSKHWLHLDIASTSWYEKPRGYIPKGATGFGLRLFIEFLKNE